MDFQSILAEAVLVGLGEMHIWHGGVLLMLLGGLMLIYNVM